MNARGFIHLDECDLVVSRVNEARDVTLTLGDDYTLFFATPDQAEKAAYDLLATVEKARVPA